MENSLKLLDPVADLELFRTAYGWRTPKKHLSPPRIDFETLTADNPTNLNVGLFNGEFQVLYFFQEFAPRRFEAHFTSRKGCPRETILWGGQQVLDLILSNGGEEVNALILPVNRPLRQFVTDIGMEYVGRVIFTCVNDLGQCNFYLPRNQRTQNTFVRYAKRS